jgi:hypothetical protein
LDQSLPTEQKDKNPECWQSLFRKGFVSVGPRLLVSRDYSKEGEPDSKVKVNHF